MRFRRVHPNVIHFTVAIVTSGCTESFRICGEVSKTNGSIIAIQGYRERYGEMR
jgi:hypothetical protein